MLFGIENGFRQSIYFLYEKLEQPFPSTEAPAALFMIRQKLETISRYRLECGDPFLYEDDYLTLTKFYRTIQQQLETY